MGHLPVSVRFNIEHRKGSLNDVADALSIIHLEMIEVPEKIQDKWYLSLRSKILAFSESYPLFRVDDQKIFRLIHQRDFLGTNYNEWKLVLPKELRRQALSECHDDPISAHLGVFKTLNRLREIYYWPDMRHDVIRFVNACKTCAQVKTSSQAKSGRMGQRKNVAYPFQMLAIDFLGPLPRTRSGNLYILVVTDCFTKFVFLKALSKAATKAVCKFLEEEIFLIFGVPQSIVCDNGSQFISKEFTNFMNYYKV